MTTLLVEEPFVNTLIEDEEDYVMTGEDFGYFLVSMRSVLGITQSKMSELLDCNQNAYNAYEKGKRLPKKWYSIQVQLQGIVKKHKEENRGKELRQHIDEPILLEIETLHNQGRNNVQIGIHLDLDEFVVIDCLEKLGHKPLIYSCGW